MADVKEIMGYNIKDAYARQEIAQMKINFQDGVDTIYNAIVAQGVTPSASTPSACADGISTVATNNYNSGKTEAEATTWSETLTYDFFSNSSSSQYLQLDARNIKGNITWRITHGVHMTFFSIYGSNNRNDWTLVTSLSPSSGQTGTVTPSYKYYKFIPQSKSGETHLVVTISCTRQAKLLR